MLPFTTKTLRGIDPQCNMLSMALKLNIQVCQLRSKKAFRENFSQYPKQNAINS